MSNSSEQYNGLQFELVHLHVGIPAADFGFCACLNRCLINITSFFIYNFFLMNCFYCNLLCFQLFINFSKTPPFMQTKRKKCVIGDTSCSEGLFTCLKLLLDHHYLLCMSCVEIIRRSKNILSIY